MRRIVGVVLASVVLVGCAGATEGRGGGPSPTPAGTDGPAVLDGASCEDVQAGNPANFPDFVDVELESEGGVDRITFVFEPDADAPARPPLHFVYFTEQLVTDGEGKPVEVEGEAFLVVAFQAIGVDLSSEQPVEVYTGPEEFTPGFGTIREAVMLGDFEGQVSWGLGLSRRECFVVEAEPDRLTLELASA